MLRVLLRSPAALRPSPSGAVAEALDAWRTAGGTVWLDVTGTARDELDRLGHVFGLHDLAIAAALTPGTRPRVQRYDHSTALTLYLPRSGSLSQAETESQAASPVAPQTETRTEPQETSPAAPQRASPAEARATRAERLAHLDKVELIFGDRFLITAHATPLPLLEQLVSPARGATLVAAHGIGGVVHGLIGGIIGAYFPVLDSLVEEGSIRDEAALSGGAAAQRALRTVSRVRRELFALRRAVAPQRSALMLLARDQSPFSGAAEPISLQDVLDHAVHLEQALVAHHEVLTSARVAYHSWIATSVARATETLLVVTCLLVVPTLITSVYGMNFVHFPELGWPLGHLWATLLILVIDGALWRAFRRRAWV
ncbi:MAG: hypothetical protein M3442_03625 [Chloroflexota bacterium]|nr:hypothetical protein [Chloroflexota bacterium]